MHSHIIRNVAACAALSLLSACGVSHELFGTGGNGPSSNAALGQNGVAPAVFGYAVADEPQAALAARQILSQGGNAADAAAAAGFALSVTLPSRAGLGGGGACIIKMQDAKGNPLPPVALLFPAGAPAAADGGRPAAIPNLARGLLAIQARYGQLPVSTIIVPAERMAGGVPVSAALANDLNVVGNALLADPAAASVFAPGGAMLQAGGNLVQPDLAATFEILRTRSVQGFYSGSFAQQFAQAADAAGGSLTLADLAESPPQFAPLATTATGKDLIAQLPASVPASQAQPAAASFAAVDKNGGVVACDVSMNNLFGTGRIAAGTGILLAASPRVMPAPTLAASVTITQGNNFRAATTGTGQGAISRLNTISCPGGVPGGEATCTASADPNGQGLAIGGR